MKDPKIGLAFIWRYFLRWEAAFGVSTILEIDKYNTIIGDTHTTIPIVVDLQEENIYIQICDQAQKMIVLAEEGVNCRDALYKSGEGHLWKNLTFTINYLGETPNIIKEIEHHYIDRHPSKYLIGYTYKGYFYIISFSDFLLSLVRMARHCVQLSITITLILDMMTLRE